MQIEALKNGSFTAHSAPDASLNFLYFLTGARNEEQSGFLLA
jgi:hypothetical protein